MAKQLVKSHRVFGYEVGRIPNPDASGKELAVVQTDASPVNGLQVVPAHTLMPATVQEVVLRLRVEISNALAQAAFLGADPEALAAAVEAELHTALAGVEVSMR